MMRYFLGFFVGFMAGAAVAFLVVAANQPICYREHTTPQEDMLRALTDTRNSTWTSTDGKPPPRYRVRLEVVP